MSTLVPVTNQESRHLLQVRVKGESAESSFKNYKIWYRNGQDIYNIQLLNPKTKTLNGVTLYKMTRIFDVFSGWMPKK